MGLLAAALVVFAITLIITKSKILACKRQFVIERYASQQGRRPNWFHTWFHAMMTCAMCCGFWCSLIICIFFRTYWYGFDVLIVFGLNWLIHCLENALFNFGKFFEIMLDDSKKVV